MLNTLSPRQSAYAIAAVLAAVIIGAWIFQFAGYEPCDLCYKQRWGYYAGIPLALVLGLLNPRWMKWGLLFLALMLVANMIFGIYHSGVEWKWWEGPTTCGAGGLSGGLPDLSKPAVLCNEAALRILGLSLAGWNAVISAGLALIAFSAFRKAH
jgi:disulfide bond formation protein DsbB